MRYLQIELVHSIEAMHPMHRYAVEDGEIHTYQLLHGNITAEEVNTFLFYVEGDLDGYETELRTLETIEDYDITHLDEDSFYLYVRERSVSTERQLLEAFSQPSLIVLPPVEYTAEKTVELTVIGESEALHTALESVPSDIAVDVGEIGEYTETHSILATVLTDRQVEALRTGVETGYYELPRAASIETIADEMGCAPGTASEHLQKAESKLISKLLS